MRFLRTSAQAAALLLAVAALASCTSDDDSGADDSTSTSTAPDVTLTRPDAPLGVRIVEMGGGIAKDRRAAISDALSKPVASWIRGSYLDPSYPTSDFAAGFSSWTTTAAKLGEKDEDTTTNAAIGPSTVAVVADRQQVKLFVFGEKGKVGGATARVYLKLTAQHEDGSLASVLVKGALFLTPADGGWKIFGYDLSRTGDQA
jgi:hypothetical protein